MRAADMPLPETSARAEGDAGFGEGEDVEVVSGDGAGGLPGAGDFDAGDLGDGAGEKRGLDLEGVAEI